MKKDETLAVEEVETNKEVAPVGKTEVVKAETPAPTTPVAQPAFQIEEGTLGAYARDLNLDWGAKLSAPTTER